jgi:hypothetical protein
MNTNTIKIILCVLYAIGMIVVGSHFVMSDNPILQENHGKR